MLQSKGRDYQTRCGKKRLNTYCLQETHQIKNTKKDEKKEKKYIMETNYKKAGVAILISEKIKF